MEINRLTHDGGGPAFARSSDGSDFSPKAQIGITVRDYIAAKALTGLLANSGLDMSGAKAAIEAYRYADAMLKARLA